jgi:acyl-CoA thioesterase I
MYPALVEKSLRQEGFDVVVMNGGVGGSTTDSGPGRLREAVRGKAKPDLLLLALGGNDGLQRTEPERIRKNLEATVRIAERHGVRTVLAGILAPPDYDRRDGYAEAFEHVFASVAKHHQLPFIASLVKGVVHDPDLNFEDLIHPNREGHRRIAEIVLPVLRNELARVEKKRNQSGSTRFKSSVE